MAVDQPPECVSIVVCDFVIEDARTRNKTLVGLFNGIATEVVPRTHPRMFVVASLTDGRGEQPVTIRVDGPSGQTIFEAKAKIKFSDPLVVHDLVLELVGMVLPEFGEYYVGVYGANGRISSRRFSVVKAKLQNAGNH